MVVAEDTVAEEDVATVDPMRTKIGKIEFTVRAVEDDGDAEERRRRRVEALGRLLLATWRLEHNERFN